MRVIVHGVLVGALLCSGALAEAQAPEATTRAEMLRHEREEKAQALSPPKPSAMERWLLRLENGRFFERLLSPPQGLHPKIGNITPGSGFAIGPGYRRPQVLGEHADLSGFATISTLGYWLLEARLRAPHVAGERVALDAFVQRSDFPFEQFYGIGPTSLRSNESRYGIRNTILGGAATFKPLPWLWLGGSVEHLSPDIHGTNDARSIERHFALPETPGIDRQPDVLRNTASVEVNYRHPRGNPRTGGKYALSYQRYLDRDTGRDSFDRVEIDLQQYVPLLRDRRVLALRAFGSLSDGDQGPVPFYFLRTLGGPDDLRGFRRFRFRDENVLLLQAEYRWEIFTAMDGAIFYDAGAVAPTRNALSLGRLESDYGIGFRFGTQNGVFLRVEGAFGSRDGKHFILRYGHVF